MIDVLAAVIASFSSVVHVVTTVREIEAATTLMVLLDPIVSSCT